MRKKAKTVFHKFLICFISALILLIVTLLLEDKYSATLISGKYSGQNVIYYYHDLDHDGKSEKIEFHSYKTKKASVLVFHNDQLIEQWNFNGNFVNIAEPVIDDFDNDGTDEIFLFTENNDSIFLNCIDAISKKIEIKEVPICRIYTINDIYSYSISHGGLYDVDGDMIKEIFFSINSGFATRPRNNFAYYPAKDTLFVSPESCALNHISAIFDMDDDGIPEIFGDNQAPGNCSYERQFSDMYSWLMVFTPKMEFKFQPVIVGKYSSSTEFCPYRYNSKNYILAYHWYQGNEDMPDYLAIFDNNGAIVKKKELTEDIVLGRANLYEPGRNYSKVYMFGSNGVIYRINNKLEFKIIAKDLDAKLMCPLQIDVDGDKEQEYIFRSKTGRKLIIYRSDFSCPVYLDLSEILKRVTISMIKSKSNLPLIAVDTDNFIYTFKYGRTNIYKYWYILFLLFFSISWFALFLFQKIREFRKIKVLNKRNQIVELQLKSIQSQIDPHFTLNLFQSFANLITEHETERAEYLFNRYASLLKATVLNSDKLFIPLQEELDFVISYLDLEQFRQRNRFSYKAIIADEINTDIQIPKMLLHTFIENAIKHGLKHLETKGKLDINASKHDGMIDLSIADNGVGREKAAKYATFSTGKGLKIMDQILDLYYFLNKIKIQYEIIDILIDNNPKGTRVNITIPV